MGNKKVQNTEASLEAFRSKPHEIYINDEKYLFHLDLNGLACLQEEAGNHLRMKPLIDEKGKVTNEFRKQPMSMDDIIIGATAGDVRCFSILLWAGIQYSHDGISYKEFCSRITLEDSTNLQAQMINILESTNKTIGTDDDIKNDVAPKTTQKK